MFDNIYGFYFPVLRSRYVLLGVLLWSECSKCIDMNTVTQESTWAHCPSSEWIHAPYSSRSIDPNEQKVQEATGKQLIFPRQRKDELSIVTQRHKRTTECRNSSGILPCPSSQTGSAGQGQIHSTTLQLPLSIVAFLLDLPFSPISIVAFLHDILQFIWLSRAFHKKARHPLLLSSSPAEFPWDFWAQSWCPCSPIPVSDYLKLCQLTTFMHCHDKES